MNQSREETKTDIATALLWELEKTPLKKMTIQQIAKRAGVSKQTFYNHFQDKEALVQYVYDTVIIPDFDEKRFPERFAPSYLHAGSDEKAWRVYEAGAASGRAERFEIVHHDAL